MAAILLDSTEFAQQLEEVGMPRAQAQVVAKGLAAMYVHNFDALVTKDYLDTRFAEFGMRLGREMDQRFAGVDQRFAEVDQRFAEVDQRFVALESRMDQRFSEQDKRMALGFARVDTQLARVNVMLAVVLVATVIPTLQKFFAWVG